MYGLEHLIREEGSVSSSEVLGAVRVRAGLELTWGDDRNVDEFVWGTVCHEVGFHCFVITRVHCGSSLLAACIKEIWFITPEFKSDIPQRICNSQASTVTLRAFCISVNPAKLKDLFVVFTFIYHRKVWWTSPHLCLQTSESFQDASCSFYHPML